MKTRALPSIIVCSVLVAACDASPPAGRDDGAVPLDAPASSDRDGALPPSDGAVPGLDGAAPMTDGGGTSDGGTAPRAMLCQQRCATSADCGTASSPLYDASHYVCDATTCRWLGCSPGATGDAECRSAFARPSYLCRAIGGLRQCVVGCSTASDCPASATPAFDADNYECVSGLCEYRGCNTDAECTATFADARYVCRRAALPDTGLPIPTAERNCVLGCAASADCSTASAAFDADNYECVDTACVYRGCNTDAECASSFSSASYVCR